MSLFSKSATDMSYLGVDIGGSSIKMVELTNNSGRAQLVTYGYLERSLSGEKTKLIDQPDKTAELIKKVATNCRAVTKRAVTALPANAVFSSIISLSEISRSYLSSPKKVTAAVEWEAKKVLPLPLEDMILDWKILGSEEILKQLSKNKVILQKHNKPVAVMLSYQQYSVLEELLDRIEEYTLGMTALERDKKASQKDFVDIEEW